MAKKSGMKSKYTTETIESIVAYISAGDTEETAAKLSGVGVSTYYDWKNKHPEFSEAIKEAKKIALQVDNARVIETCRKSLGKLIEGFEHETVRTELEPNPADPSRPRIKKMIKEKKYFPPNVTAIIFALTNIDTENWKNRNQTELSGKVATEGSSDISLANVPDDLLAQVIEKIRK